MSPGLTVSLALTAGIRSGLPGFVAVELCPNLVMLPRDMQKYRKYANLLWNVFRNYDPHFLPLSLDEASLNLTNYLQRNYGRPEEVLAAVRSDITRCDWLTDRDTALPCSIGCGPTRMIAKLAAEHRKPNGSFVVQSNREEAMAFLADMPVRKVRHLLTTGAGDR